MARMRRLTDVAGALTGLVIFGPVMLTIAFSVLLEDGRPILFRQERVGRHRRPFMILKFRSMRDGEITRVGRVLRATGLDEIAQFVNILRGDMGVVGPRPLTAADVERLGWVDASFDFRWKLPPGLTGLAQLAGGAAADESLALDRAYLERRNLLLDAQLIALSFAVNVLGKQRLRRWLGRRRSWSSSIFR